MATPLRSNQPNSANPVESLAISKCEATAPPPSTRLCRSFRMRDGVALIISNVIGVGIFTTPVIIAKLVPEPRAILGLWIAGGALAIVRLPDDCSRIRADSADHTVFCDDRQAGPSEAHQSHDTEYMYAYARQK